MNNIIQIKKLIACVGRNPELWDHDHKDYFNHVRREKIWEDISATMRQSSDLCKDRWVKVRDNHRKALQRRRRKIVNGQHSKPAKFEKELSFLVPFIMDDDSHSIFNSSLFIKEENSNNIDEDVNATDEDNSLTEQAESPTSSQGDSRGNTPANVNREDSDNASHDSATIHAPQKRKKRTMNQPKSAANKEEPKKAEKDDEPLMDFFTAMAKTVREFPQLDQIQIKMQVSKLVLEKEMEISQR